MQIAGLYSFANGQDYIQTKYPKHFKEITQAIKAIDANACKTKAKCYDERDSCDVLNQDIKRIVEESWLVGQERPVKGYKIEIVEEVGSIYNPVIPAIQAGNETLNYKNAVEVLSGGIRVFFNAYY